MRTSVKTIVALLAMNLATACSNWPVLDGQFLLSKNEKSGSLEEKGTEKHSRLTGVYSEVAKMALKHGHADTAQNFFTKAANLEPRRTRNGTVAATDLRHRPMTEQQIGFTSDHIKVEMPNQTLSNVVAFSALELVHLFEHPTDRDPLNQTAVSHDYLGDHTLAQKIYRESLKAEPENLSLRHNLAISLAMSGAYSESVREMSRVTMSSKATLQHRRALALLLHLDPQIDGITDILYDRKKEGREEDRHFPDVIQVKEDRVDSARSVSKARRMEALGISVSVTVGQERELKSLTASEAIAVGDHAPQDHGAMGFLIQTASTFWERLQTSIRPAHVSGTE